MSWLGWIHMATAAALNLHAVAAIALARGTASAPAVRGWARRSAWLLFAYLGLSALVVGLLVRGGEGALTSADPSMRATELARHISEGINCVAVFFMGSVLPGIVAIWLGRKGRRG
jgi:hypothetical protein